MQIGQSVVRVKKKSEVALAALFLDGDGIGKCFLELAVGMVLAKPKKLVKGELYGEDPDGGRRRKGTMFMVETSTTRRTRVGWSTGSAGVKALNRPGEY